MFILLDIDGVMVPAKGWKAPEFMDDGFPAFTNTAVRSLNMILKRTGATIVLITSHSARFDETEWTTIFSRRGIRADIQKYRSNSDSTPPRNELVLNWLSSNSNVRNFIIIDDDKSLNGLPSDLKENNLILTSPHIGLNDSLAESAIEKLTHT